MQDCYFADHFAQVGAERSEAQQFWQLMLGHVGLRCIQWPNIATPMVFF